MPIDFTESSQIKKDFYEIVLIYPNVVVLIFKSNHNPLINVYNYIKLNDQTCFQNMYLHVTNFKK